MSIELTRADILAIAEWYARLVKLVGQQRFDGPILKEIDRRASLLGGRFADKRKACESIYRDLLRGVLR